MDKRTELAQKALRRFYVRCRLHQIHIDFFLMNQKKIVVSSIDRNRGFPLIIDRFPLYPFLLF
jgi:hypothetical protein